MYIHSESKARDHGLMTVKTLLFFLREGRVIAIHVKIPEEKQRIIKNPFYPFWSGRDYKML